MAEKRPPSEEDLQETINSQQRTIESQQQTIAALLAAAPGQRTAVVTGMRAGVVVTK